MFMISLKSIKSDFREIHVFLVARRIFRGLKTHYSLIGLNAD